MFPSLLTPTLGLGGGRCFVHTAGLKTLCVGVGRSLEARVCGTVYLPHLKTQWMSELIIVPHLETAVPSPPQNRPSEEAAHLSLLTRKDRAWVGSQIPARPQELPCGGVPSEGCWVGSSHTRVSACVCAHVHATISETIVTDGALADPRFV